MSARPPGRLQGLCILNTRPRHQQAALQALLQADGARVLSFPTIEIIQAEADIFLQTLPTCLPNYQIAIFISRNAVEGAFAFLGTAPLPQDLRLAVIGAGTYRALQKKIIDLEQRIIRGTTYNSEGLLAVAPLQNVAGKNIIIFRGQPGRTLLGDTLRNRGANVRYCEVYRRKCPDYTADVFLKCCRKQFPSLVVLTSREGMNNLLSLLEPDSRQKLLHCPWLLISERMRESAVNLGHNADIIVARKASDAGIHQAICEWVQSASS